METNLQEMEQKLAGLMQGWSLREVMSRYEGQEVRIPYKELVPFQEIINTSGEIWFKRTKQEREERIRKEALALWESDREEEKLICFDLVSGENCYDFTDSELFEEACIERNEFATELLTAGLTEDTKAYIRTETAGFTDKQILTMFDPSMDEYCSFLDESRYPILICIYIARRSEELREGILSMFRKSIRHDLASRHAMKSPEDYDLAYKKFSIPDEILQERAEYKLSEHEEYDLFREVKHYLTLRERDAITSKRVSYPSEIIRAEGTIERHIKKFGIHITQEFENIYRGSRNREIDCKLNFSNWTDIKTFSEDSLTPTILEELNRKYDIPKNEAGFMYDVISAIGSFMLAHDGTYTADKAKKGIIAISKPLIITMNEIIKYIRNDLSSRLTPKSEEDIKTAIKCAGNIKVRMQKIRNADNSFMIEERALECAYCEIIVNGKKTIGWRVQVIPPFVRYSLIMGYIRTQKMITAEAGPRRITQSRKSHIIINGLESYVKNYRKKNDYLTINFDTVVEEYLGADALSEISENRVKRKRTYNMIEKAAEDLKRRGVINSFEVETKLLGQKQCKKLILNVKRNEEKN